MGGGREAQWGLTEGGVPPAAAHQAPTKQTTLLNQACLLLLLVLGCCRCCLHHVAGHKVLAAGQAMGRHLAPSGQRRLAPVLGRRLGGCRWWVGEERHDLSLLTADTLYAVTPPYPTPNARCGRRGSFSCECSHVEGLTSSAPLGGPMERAAWISLTPREEQGTLRGASGPACRLFSLGGSGGLPEADGLQAAGGWAASRGATSAIVAAGMRVWLAVRPGELWGWWRAVDSVQGMPQELLKLANDFYRNETMHWAAAKP